MLAARAHVADWPHPDVHVHAHDRTNAGTAQLIYITQKANVLPTTSVGRNEETNMVVQEHNRKQTRCAI